MKVTYKAAAKINLMLDILSRLDNGYHSLFMIMQSVSLFDEVSVESLFSRFLQQLIHRGYRPVQYREKDLDDHLSSWKPCNLTGLDETDLIRGEDAAVDIGENFEDF